MESLQRVRTVSDSEAVFRTCSVLPAIEKLIGVKWDKHLRVYGLTRPGGMLHKSAGDKTPPAGHDLGGGKKGPCPQQGKGGKNDPCPPQPLTKYTIQMIEDSN